MILQEEREGVGGGGERETAKSQFPDLFILALLCQAL